MILPDRTATVYKMDKMVRIIIMVKIISVLNNLQNFFIYKFQITILITI